MPGVATVCVPAVLQGIMPRYLESKQRDMGVMEEALARGDFESIRVLGHNWKGSGAGYGILRISEAGKRVEAAARERNAEQIQAELASLREYLRSLQIVYE